MVEMVDISVIQVYLWIYWLTLIKILYIKNLTGNFIYRFFCMKRKKDIKSIKRSKRAKGGRHVASVGGGESTRSGFMDNLPERVDAPNYLPKRRISVRDITPEELLFAYEWADHPKDIKKALLGAGIIGPKDSKKTVQKLEYEFTHNPKVLQAYQEALFNKLETLQITNNRIDSHLGVIAFTDRGLCKSEDGSNIPVHKLPWEIRQCIQEFEERMYYPPKGHPYKKTRIKFYSTVEALRMLRKNNDDDTERAIGMGKAIASNGGIINISNYNNCGNSTYNGDVNNNTMQLDISRLNEKELNILLKAMDKQIPVAVQQIEDKVDEILEDEILEAKIEETKEKEAV